MRRLHDLRHSINMLWERLPENLKRGPEVRLARRIPLRDYHGHR
ncbi:hypothetical protein [Bradyrhizobium sp. sGM-13]